MALAAEFGREAFAILDWMQSRPGMREVYARNKHRITSGAYRLSARYLLDGGFNGRAFAHYMKSLWYHPATAWSEKRRMLYALGSLILPLGKLRDKFVSGRTRKIRADILQEYKNLFDYGQEK